MDKLSSNELLKTAMRRTGLSEFGGGEIFRHDFDLLVSSLDVNSVPEDRRGHCVEYILRLLVNRLWFEKDLADHPEILEQQLLPPVAIVSLPRAGTTKLQWILHEMGCFQNLFYWQVHNFARIPGEIDGGKAIRVKQAVQFIDWLKQVEPDIMQTHPIGAEEVEEEFLLMGASFRSRWVGSIFPAQQYSMWLDTADMAPAYDYLVKQLQYVQWQSKLAGETVKPWLLKSPGQLGLEDQLTRTFQQGIKIITPHRDPADIIPSTTRTAHINNYFGPKIDLKYFGPFVIDWFGMGIQRYMDWRKRNKTAEVLDLSFQETSNDSLETAKRVCDFLDIPLTDAVVDRIKQLDIRKPRDKYGKNVVRLEEYGVDAQKVKDIFKPYIDEYNKYF